jgi:hypothetical protein
VQTRASLWAKRAWAVEYENRWIGQCIDEPCYLGIRLLKNGVVFDGKGRETANPNVDFGEMSAALATAETRARGVAAASVGRKASEYASANGVLAIGVWTPQCKDDVCKTNITNLAGEMGNAAMALALEVGPPPIRIPGQAARQAPLPTPLGVSRAINERYVEKFQKEVADSTLRSSLDQSARMRRQLQQQRIPMPRTN